MNKIKFSVLLLICSLFLVSSSFASEDNSGKIGMRLYQLHKPRIANGNIVFDIVPSSPAWKAGIKLADRVIKVDGIDVSKKSVDEVTNMLRGKIGTSVKITLLTRNGVQDFTLQREAIDVDKITPYPHWYQICNNPKTEGEICYIHPSQYNMKASDWFKIMGPYGVNYYGSQLAAQRYQFEDNLQLCQESKDKAMCYLEIKKTIQSNALAQQSVQLQRALLLNQTLNGLNNDLNMQTINRNLNYNFNNLNNNLFNINNNLQRVRYKN